MKISDFVFRCPAHSSWNKDGIYRIRIFVSKDYLTYVVITDLGEKNTGQSVTNGIEKIINALVFRGFVKRDFLFVEHYEKSDYTPATFDFFTLDETNKPEWKSISLNDLRNHVGCDEKEFGGSSLEDKKIYDEVERIRHEINPYIGEPWKESYDVINRREDIYAKSLPEGTLTSAILAGASEQEIQKLIKLDLSILGDFYAQPSEEYICFSEFPLADGFVDFVIFSGRSRMDVTLIEIKGADYNLITENSYSDFSAKTNQAVQQIRSRMGYITRNESVFRKFVHDVRADVENGFIKYNALVGPQGNLHVDPDKDINLHTVVIGGRSKDDIHESRLRHEYERGNSPPIRVESWDSWIKKSRRS